MLRRRVNGIGGSTEAKHLSADLLRYLHLVDLPLLQDSQLLQDEGNTQLGSRGCS